MDLWWKLLYLHVVVVVVDFASLCMNNSCVGLLVTFALASYVFIFGCGCLILFSFPLGIVELHSFISLFHPFFLQVYSFLSL